MIFYQATNVVVVTLKKAGLYWLNWQGKNLLINLMWKRKKEEKIYNFRRHSAALNLSAYQEIYKLSNVKRREKCSEFLIKTPWEKDQN